jgi:hypothetical protein
VFVLLRSKAALPELSRFNSKLFEISGEGLVIRRQRSVLPSHFRICASAVGESGAYCRTQELVAEKRPLSGAVQRGYIQLPNVRCITPPRTFAPHLRQAGSRRRRGWRSSGRGCFRPHKSWRPRILKHLGRALQKRLFVESNRMPPGRHGATSGG